MCTIPILALFQFLVDSLLKKTTLLSNYIVNRHILLFISILQLCTAMCHIELQDMFAQCQLKTTYKGCSSQKITSQEASKTTPARREKMHKNTIAGIE